MNSPFALPQGSAAHSAAAQTRVITITKPANGQSYTVQLSHDGSVKLDLSQIANEKITIVKVPSDVPGAGEKAIIIFDNQAAITIDPFFFSGQWPLQLTIDTGTQHDLTVSDFASIFPVTTDTSIIPAGGEQAQQSGATFEPPAVDPISSGDPLPLLPPEELPNWQITPLLANEFVNDLPTFGLNPDVLLDEDFLSKANGAPFDGNQDLPTPSLGDDAGSFDFSGLLHYDFHNDGPAATNPIVIDTASLNALGLKSSGAAVVFDWNPVTFTLTGYVDNDGTPGLSAGDKTVVKLVIDPATATGPGNDHAFTVTLSAPLDHTVSGTEDNITLPLNLTITDSNNDSDSGVVNVVVDDDLPFATGEIVQRTADEDDIATPWSLGTSPDTNPEFPGDQSVTQGGGGFVHPAVVTGSVAGLVSFGADGPGSYGFSADAIAYFKSLNLFSKQTAQPENGISLDYTVTQDAANHTVTLHAFEPDTPAPGITGNPVFDFVLDTQTGDFTFKLFDELIHTPGDGENTDLRSGGPGLYDTNNDGVTDTVVNSGATSSIPYLDFGHIITATDGDGDPVTLNGEVQIFVKDDVPEAHIFVIPHSFVQHDETAGIQSGPGDGDTASLAVRLHFASLESTANVGNDTDVAHFPGSPAIGYAQSPLPVVFDATFLNYGADFPPESRTFSLQVTDGTFSGVSTTEGVNIYLYKEGDLVVGRLGGDSDATPDSPDPNGTIAFAIAIQQNGKLDLAQYLSLNHPNTASKDESISLDNSAIKAVLTITDSDGDTDTDAANIGARIRFDDDGPKLIGDRVTVRVDEDDILNGQSIGTSPNDGNGDGSFTGSPADNFFGPAFVSGSVASSVNFGADGEGSFTFASNTLSALSSLGLTSKGGTIHYDVSGDTLTAYVDRVVPNSTLDNFDRKVFTLELDSNGDYQFKLFDQLDHVTDNGQNTALQGANGPVSGLHFGSLIVATDGDGDPVTLNGKLTIKITDDIPQILAFHETGAEVTIDETGGNHNDNVTGFGAAVLAALFSGLQNVGHDADMGNQPVFAANLAPVVAGAFVPGADEPASFDVSLQLNGQASPVGGIDSGLTTTDGHTIYLFKEGDFIVGRIDGDGNNHIDPNGSPQDVAAFAIGINQLGEVGIVQYLSIHHDDPTNPDDTQTMADNLISAELSVTDFDGDTVSQSVNIGGDIHFDDDGPKLIGHDTITYTADEDDILNLQSIGTSPDDGNGDGSFTGAPADNIFGPAFVSGSLAASVDFGADGPGSFSFALVAPSTLEALGLTSKGGAVHYNLDGDTLTAFVDRFVSNGTLDNFDRTVFTLTVDHTTGDFQFKLFDQLDHVTDNGENTDLQGANGPVSALDFGSLIVATDGDGDPVDLDGKLTIQITDDIPEILKFETTGESVRIDETGGNADDNTNSNSVANLFNGVQNVGHDAEMNNNAPVFAHEGSSAVFALWLSGADEPASTALSLGINGAAAPGLGVDSGLTTTDGHKIYLFNEGGIIVGRIDGDGDNHIDPNGSAQDVAAFAITISQSGDLSVAQYLSIHHDDPTDNDDTQNLGQLISANLMVTDFDGDSVSQSIDIGNKIRFDDDGPKVHVHKSGVDADTLLVNLDETVQPDNASAPGYDRYNTPETESGPGVTSNGGADDVVNNAVGPIYNRTPVVETAPDANEAIGHLETAAGSLAALFTTTSDFGADGPASPSTSTQFSLGLSGGATLLTTLTATALTGTPLETMTAAERAISLVQNGNVIEGRIAGTAAAGDEYVVFRISLVDAGDPANAHLAVDQFMPIDHGGTENPSIFDEVASLLISGGGSLDLTETVTITDGDQDQDSDSATIKLITGRDTILTFDDDGPQPAQISEANFANNGLFFSGFIENGNIWGPHSGVAIGTAGDWTIAASPVGGAAQPQLERVAESYAGVDSPTDSLIVDLEATPGNIQISQDVTGLAAGTKYLLTFELGEANFGNAKLEVVWDGNVVATFDPNPGAMQTISLELLATSSTETLIFREIGTSGDNTGSYLANVRLTNLIIIDETPNVDADSNDTLDPAVAAMFATVALPGSDLDMGSPQFATGTSAVVSVTAADFGTDGPAAHDPVQFGLHIASSGVDSGLTTTENQTIKLFLEGGIIVGRYDSNNSNTVDATDNAALAIAIDATTGILSVAQYVSLHHPDITDTDEGIQLAPGTVLVDVTLTDGDGDTSLASTDISNAVLFEDDGPTLTVDFGRQPADLSLALDETVQPDNASNPNFDHYNGAETESGGGASNGGSDDVVSAAGPLYNHTPVVSVSPLASQAIGSLTTAAGAIASQFNVSAIFGADGPGPNGGLSENLSLVLSSNGAATNLHATDTSDPLLAGLSENARAIYLIQTGNVIEGRIAGADEVSNGGGDEYVAFRITLNNASDPSTASITVDQFMAIEHGDTSTFDENTILKLVDGTLGLKLDITATDGDLDPEEKSVTLNLANNDGSFISFDDDGPTIKAVTPAIGPNLVQNGSFEGGHGDIGSPDWNIYGSLPGGWTTGPDNIPFEVQTGGVGGIGAEDGNALIELDGDTEGNPAHTPQGTPDPVHTDATIQQVIAGTVAGQTYEISFWYSPRPGHSGGDDSGLNVLWNGSVVQSIDSTGVTEGQWHLITVSVTATGPNNTLGFQGTGNENEFGALLDNVSLRAVTILDDEDTTLDPAIEVQGGPGDDGHGVTATGKIDFDAGTDGLHSIEFNPVNGLKAVYVDASGKGTQEDVTTQWTPDGHGGGTLTGTSTDFGSGNPVFTLVVGNSGNYTFTLNAPLAHPAPDGNPPSFENNLLLNLGFTITDGDGDTATGSLDINVDDDSPLANNDVDTIHALASVTGNVITGAGSDDPAAAQDSPGADGGQITSISFGQTNATADVNGDFTISGDHGTLVLNEDGSYTYTRTTTSAGQDVFTYTLTDGDGDSTTATLTINLDSTGLPTAVDANVAADEDNLTVPPADFAGNNDSAAGDDDQSGLTGSLGSFGPDGPGSVSFAVLNGVTVTDTSSADVKSGGTTLKYFWDGANTLYASINIANAAAAASTAVFKVVIDQTDASYTFTLLNHLDHAAGGVENNINIDLPFTISDVTPDTANGTLHVSVDDDLPVINSIQNAIVANTDGVAVGDILVNYGADGANSTSAATVDVTTDAGARTTNSGLVITGWDDLPGITETLSADGKMLTATIDATAATFYTLQLDDTTNDYTLTYSARPVVQQDITFSDNGGGAGTPTIEEQVGDLTVTFDGILHQSGVFTDPNDSTDQLKPTGNGFGVGSGGGSGISDDEGFFVTVTRDVNGNPVPTTADSLSFSLLRNGGGGGAHTAHLHWIAYDDNGNQIVGGTGFNAGSGDQLISLVDNNTPVAITIDPPGEFAKLVVWMDNEVGQNSVGIESFKLGTSIIPEDQPLHFDVAAIDGDGDISATSGLDVLLSGGAGPGFTLTGTAASEVLVGGGDNDVLTGGGAADTLSGKAGADIFKYNASTEGTDHILDFNAAEGDTIDVLISGFAGLNPGDAGKTADQVPGLFDADTSGTEATTAPARFHFDAANHTLYYDSDGVGGVAAVALATFDNDATVQAQNVHLT